MRTNRLFALLSMILWMTAGPASGAELSTASTSVEFDRQIRPILSENCFACHGPDENKRKARLRLDQKEGALAERKKGRAAVVPGDPENSLLIERITTSDPIDVMPPPKTGKKLTPEQVDLLTRWIKEGAAWQSHWAYVKPERPPLPAVPNPQWPRNEIDYFVLARLEKENLKPAPEADKPTLIRRATLDLTGLPPTPQEVDAYLADNSPESYDRLVDRLVNSPRYGEQMARYWMDAARYADSHGYHIDAERSMWKWREWVVNAFNKNLPFDEFTRQQIAGDLLRDADTQQKIASGYLRANMSTGEGGAIVDEYQAKYTFDRTETTSTIWMGLTMTCARCHTHKYDPITHREYYGLYAFFNSLDEAVMDGNRPNPDPFLKIPTSEQTQRQEWLAKRIAEAQTRIDAPAPALDQAQADWQGQWHKKLSLGWNMLMPYSVASTASNGAHLRILEDRSIIASGPNPEQDVYEFKTWLDAGDLAALRLQVLPADSLPQKSSARAEDGRFRLSEFEAEIVPSDQEGKPGKPQKLKFAHAIADTSEPPYEIAKAIDGKADTGWGIAATEATAPHSALFLLGEPLSVAADSELRVRLRHEASKSRRAIGHFRLATAQSGELVQRLTPPKFGPWQVLGPLKAANQTAGFETAFEPESQVDLKKSYPGVRDEVKWHAKPDFADDKSNLLVQDLHGIHGVYYLHRSVNVSEARQMDLGLRADGVFKVWVNGTLAVEESDPDQAPRTMHRATVSLQKGENRILAKIVTVQGAAHFTFTQQVGDLHAPPVEIAAILATGRNLSAPQQTELRDFYRRQSSPEFKALLDDARRSREERAFIEKAIPSTLVAKELAQPRETFILERGEYDKKGEKVTPGVPGILPPFPKDAPTNRLGLAQWLLDPSHPLTARVTVNRFWQQYFGVGLVKTAEDFGVQGEQPSHPALLDWLATEFVRTGWDVKRLQKLIVTSATYRQSSAAFPELRARDPENRLLARGPRFRMDAEMVRDTALYVSGLLVEEIGGASVKPYQPAGLWQAVSFNNSQKYVPDSGDSQYRRSLYTYWKRQSPPPNMLLFDAPTREYCVVRRPRTSTPLQALVLLNDPQFVEAARAFAERILLEGGETAESRIAYAFRLATARTPEPDEIRVLQEVLKAQLDEFRGDQSAANELLSVGSYKTSKELAPDELAAWTTIASMILNLDETITKG